MIYINVLTTNPSDALNGLARQQTASGTTASRYK